MKQLSGTRRALYWAISDDRQTHPPHPMHSCSDEVKALQKLLFDRFGPNENSIERSNGFVVLAVPEHIFNYAAPRLVANKLESK